MLQVNNDAVEPALAPPTVTITKHLPPRSGGRPLGPGLRRGARAVIFQQTGVCCVSPYGRLSMTGCLSLRQDLKETFIDSGVMTAIKEWISPLPDKSLPALRIREELLRILMEVSAHPEGGVGSIALGPAPHPHPHLSSLQLPSVSQETLKHSGIGRAVMFLYKHPKESRSNKDLALKLISKLLCDGVRRVVGRAAAAEKGSMQLCVISGKHERDPDWPPIPLFGLDEDTCSAFPLWTLTECKCLLCASRRVVAADLRAHVQLQGDDERGAAAEGPGPADASETQNEVRTECRHFLSPTRQASREDPLPVHHMLFVLPASHPPLVSLQLYFTFLLLSPPPPQPASEGGEGRGA